MPSEATQRSFEEQIRRMTPVSAPPEQQADVAAISRLLDRVAHAHRRRLAECKLVGPAGESIAIPEAMFYVFERVAELLARGDSITITGG